MRANLTERPTYWRSGVILDIDGNRRLTRADVDAGRIYISVGGPSDGRRRALSVIRNTFKAIHDTIPRLEPSEKVPITADQVIVDYLHLLRLEHREVETFLPEGAEREYSVRTLLEGIEPRPAKRRKPAAEQEPEFSEPMLSLKRIAALSGIFGSVLITLIGALAIVGYYVNNTVLAFITTAGVLFMLVFMIMVGAFTGVIRQTVLLRLVDQILRKLPGSTSEDRQRQRTKDEAPRGRRRNRAPGRARLVEDPDESSAKAD